MMNSTVKDINELPFLLSVDPDLMNVMRVGRVKAYEIANSKGFPKIKVGKSIKIPRESFVKWLENQAVRS